MKGAITKTLSNNFINSIKENISTKVVNTIEFTKNKVNKILSKNKSTKLIVDLLKVFTAITVLNGCVPKDETINNSNNDQKTKKEEIRLKVEKPTKDQILEKYGLESKDIENNPLFANISNLNEGLKGIPEVVYIEDKNQFNKLKESNKIPESFEYEKLHGFYNSKNKISYVNSEINKKDDKYLGVKKFNNSDYTEVQEVAGFYADKIKNYTPEDLEERSITRMHGEFFQESHMYKAILNDLSNTEKYSEKLELIKIFFNTISRGILNSKRYELIKKELEISLKEELKEKEDDYLDLISGGLIDDPFYKKRIEGLKNNISKIHYIDGSLNEYTKKEHIDMLSNFVENISMRFEHKISNIDPDLQLASFEYDKYLENKKNKKPDQLDDDIKVAYLKALKGDSKENNAQTIKKEEKSTFNPYNTKSNLSTNTTHTINDIDKDTSGKAKLDKKYTKNTSGIVLNTQINKDNNAAA